MSQWVPCHNGGTHRNSWCAQVGSTAIDAQEEGITVPCPDFLREWMRVTVVGEFFFGIFWLFEFHGFSMVFMELRRTGDGRLGLPMTAWNMKFVEGCGVQASKEWGKKWSPRVIACPVHSNSHFWSGYDMLWRHFLLPTPFLLVDTGFILRYQCVSVGWKLVEIA